MPATDVSVSDELVILLEKLTGQPVPSRPALPPKVHEVLSTGAGIGHSQFNELLLLLGYDRICPELFQFLVDGLTDYRPGSAIRSVDQLRDAVVRFRRLALLLFGNVKFAFKRLGANPDELNSWIATLEPIDVDGFKKRHEPIQPIDPIDPGDTYLLGYVIEADLKSLLAANPSDAAAVALSTKRQAVIAQGQRNQSAYLVSDHLDVYVATSMRERHEYLAVSELCNKIFSNSALAELKLRWFDPTQAYCVDRIDKGLAEALMLKRARCTLYLVQESDTLGKDSELASTLAQGKPVIAYVPDPDAGYVDRLLEKLAISAPQLRIEDLVLQQLRVFAPIAAWNDPDVQRWLANPSSATAEIVSLKARLATAIKQSYDQRARMLKETHPLGIQVNLATGVANGVLVVRNEDDCAQLIRRIVTATLEFDVVEEVKNEQPYVFLREQITGCIFRVMTGDQQLTNAFWNFYLQAGI